MRRVLVVVLLLVAIRVAAQTTGALNGTATAGGAPLPGVTVSLTSIALQGIRSTVTGANGDYLFPSLPPGTYKVTFDARRQLQLLRAGHRRRTPHVVADVLRRMRSARAQQQGLPRQDQLLPPDAPLRQPHVRRRPDISPRICGTSRICSRDSRAGCFSAGVLERMHSGAPYSAAGAIDSRGFSNPNGYYATPPSSVTYYFSPRGAYRLDAISSTDLTATLTFHRMFVRADLLNVFNQQGVEFAATSIGSVVETRVYTRKQAARSSDGLVALQAFDPRTTTPVQYIPGKSDPNAGPYHYELDPHFGEPVNKDAYQLPRTMGFAIGLRF